jgi:hypothetical protein
MRRIATAMTVTFLGLGVLPASAQTQPTPVPAVFVTTTPDTAFTFRRAVGPAAVVDRLLSFDADGDDRVTAAELPERMQGVVDRVDQDDDGFITAAEIEAAVDRRPVVVQGGSIALRNRSVSSLSDVVHDLKLPQPKHDRAIAIVKNYQVPRNLNNSKSIDLDVVHTAMKELLDEEEFGDFMAAAARLNVRGNVNVTIQQLRGVLGNQTESPAPVRVVR